MITTIILPYRDILIGVFEYGSTIVVDVEVVGSGEDGYYRGKLLGGGLAMHRVSAPNAQS